MTRKKAAVFIDRDGTLIEEKHHLASIDQVSILSNSFEAVRKINGAGLLAIVVTNQSVVARGLVTELQLSEIHRILMERFTQNDAMLAAIYYCPHHPEDGIGSLTRDCNCRKPRPGLLLQAAIDHGIDLNSSVLIGDTLSDIEAGHRAGSRSVLVRTGYGKEAEAQLSISKDPLFAEQYPDYIASDILGAARWIVDQKED